MPRGLCRVDARARGFEDIRPYVTVPTPLAPCRLGCLAEVDTSWLRQHYRCSARRCTQVWRLAAKAACYLRWLGTWVLFDELKPGFGAGYGCLWRDCVPTGVLELGAGRGVPALLSLEMAAFPGRAVAARPPSSLQRLSTRCTQGSARCLRYWTCGPSGKPQASRLRSAAVGAWPEPGSAAIRTLGMPERGVAAPVADWWLPNHWLVDAVVS